jgi:hypothetical protein
MVKKAGFWWSEQNPDLPMPIAQAPWTGQSQFLQLLQCLEQKYMKCYREYVNQYNAHRTPAPVDPGHVIAYRGWSTCRICGTHNGSREFHVDGWQWPEGYRHYLSAHNVEPDPEFKAFVEAQVQGLHVKES